MNMGDIVPSGRNCRCLTLRIRGHIHFGRRFLPGCQSALMHASSPDVSREATAGKTGSESNGQSQAERGLLTAVVPAFNEVGSIGSVVSEMAAIRNAVADLGLRMEICAIDDGSTDGTGKAALAAGADRVISHGKNMGLGAAVRTGFVHARNRGSEIMVKLDADEQHDPSDIPTIAAPILSGSADIVYGNRFPKIAHRMPLARRFGNCAFRVLMRWLTGWDIADSQPGFFGVDRRTFRHS